MDGKQGGGGGDNGRRSETAPLDHDLRRTIMDTLAEVGGVTSAREVADGCDVSFETAHYHLSVLERAGLVEVAEVQHGEGGAILRIFRATTTGRASAA